MVYLTFSMYLSATRGAGSGFLTGINAGKWEMEGKHIPLPQNMTMKNPQLQK